MINLIINGCLFNNFSETTAMIALLKINNYLNIKIPNIIFIIINPIY